MSIKNKILNLVEISASQARGTAGKILPPCTCTKYADGGDVLCKCENSLRPTIQKKAFAKKVS